MLIKWSDTTSPQFTVMSGVKQCGVLSPILFAIYTDGLLNRLEDIRVGCHMGCRFTGALAYADDITLLASCCIINNDCCLSVGASVGRLWNIFHCHVNLNINGSINLKFGLNIGCGVV